MCVCVCASSSDIMQGRKSSRSTRGGANLCIITIQFSSVGAQKPGRRVSVIHKRRGLIHAEIRQGERERERERGERDNGHGRPAKKIYSRARNAKRALLHFAREQSRGTREQSRRLMALSLSLSLPLRLCVCVLSATGLLIMPFDDCPGKFASLYLSLPLAFFIIACVHSQRNKIEPRRVHVAIKGEIHRRGEFLIRLRSSLVLLSTMLFNANLDLSTSLNIKATAWRRRIYISAPATGGLIVIRRTRI